MSQYTQNIYITTLGVLADDYSTEGFVSMNGDIVFYYGKGEDETEKSLKLWCSNNATILKDTEWFAKTAPGTGYSMEITAITPQKHDAARCNIEVDGRFFCGMQLLTVMEHRLKVGSIVTEEELSQLQLAGERQDSAR